MSEETNDASRTIPMVVVWAVAANAAMLWIVGITLIFCLGDLDSVLNSTTGQPVIQIFYNATGSVAGTSVMVAVVLVIFLSACVGQVATSSRQMWSFARDNGKLRCLSGGPAPGNNSLSSVSHAEVTNASISQAFLALDGFLRSLQGGTFLSMQSYSLQSSLAYSPSSTWVDHTTSHTPSDRR